MDERVLASGNHWTIAKTKSTIEICFYCVDCGHQIAQHSRHGGVFWRHRRSENKSYSYSTACTECGCERPEPPSMEERNKAYAALQRLREEWKWQRTKQQLGEDD